MFSANPTYWCQEYVGMARLGGGEGGIKWVGDLGDAGHGLVHVRCIQSINYAHNGNAWWRDF